MIDSHLKMLGYVADRRDGFGRPSASAPFGSKAPAPHDDPLLLVMHLGARVSRTERQGFSALVLSASSDLRCCRWTRVVIWEMSANNLLGRAHRRIDQLWVHPVHRSLKRHYRRSDRLDRKSTRLNSSHVS